MSTYVLAVFCVVYLGMILGGLPFLQLDRTGIALLGAIALVGAGAVTPEQAARSVHLPTLLLLFAFMVLSAQMRLGGFYSWVTRRVAPPRSVFLGSAYVNDFDFNNRAYRVYVQADRQFRAHPDSRARSTPAPRAARWCRSRASSTRTRPPPPR